MRHLIDQDDEQAVLNELARNQRKAELISRVCLERGKVKSAANWATSAQRIGHRLVLLKGVFQHKN